MARRNGARRGLAWLVSHGVAGLGGARHGKARPVTAWFGMAGMMAG
jgi:hypothetical protein